MTQPDDLRPRVLRLMWASMNIWMDGFAFATHHIARAVADGRITESTIAEFPDEPTLDDFRTLANAAGLAYCGTDEPITDDDGYLVSVDDDELTSAADVLCAIPRGDAGLNDDPGDHVWRFYPELVAEQNLTVTDLIAFWQTLTLRDAAHLLVDAADVPNYGKA